MTNEVQRRLRCFLQAEGHYALVCICGLLAGLAAGLPPGAAAQVADSIPSYDLAEIVVEDAGAPASAATVATTQRVTLAALARSDAATVDAALRLVPAAHVQTNSRGETLVYLRGAGERQTAVFFDGALLNVPWDQRFDLSMLPAGVVGSITVTKGVPSVLYGTNVLGGALNLTARALSGPGAYTEARLSAGWPAQRRVQGAHVRQTARGFDLAAAAGFTGSDGQVLPAGADLPFSQADGDLRTNTDRRLASVYARVGRQVACVRWAVSALHVDGRKGVAPEGHLDPGADRVRYWRYPRVQNTLLVGHGEALLGGARLRATAWGSRFAQTIRQYASDAYDALLREQDDEDLTAGLRLAIYQPLGRHEVQLALNALTSQHEQAEAAPGESASAPATYRQHIASAGAEVAVRPAARLTATLGASLDGIATPATGDKPPRDPQGAIGVAAGARYAISETGSVRLGLGRKVRFPTMRELFGEALGRFLVNPGLRPETSIQGELGVAGRTARAQGEIVVFAARTFDTIDQRRVRVEGEDRPRRQRVNLEGSRTVGAEVSGSVRLGASWDLGGHATWLRARALEEGGGVRPLAEKPAGLATFYLARAAAHGLTGLVQATYTGRAYSPDAEDVLQPLPRALSLDVRLGYRLPSLLNASSLADLYARVDNLTDTLVLPQLGLPAPGRTFRVGIEATF